MAGYTHDKPLIGDAMAAKEESRKTVRIPLIGQTFSRPSGGSLFYNTGKDMSFTNVLFSKRVNPFSKQEQILCHQRPGIRTGTTFSGATSLLTAGLVDYPTPAEVALVADSNGDLRIYETTTLAATITATSATNASRMASFPISTTEGGIAFQFLDSATPRAFIYNLATDTATEITDADFPDSVTTGNFVYKNGYLYIMTTTGLVYNSDLNSSTSWGSTSFISTRVGAGGRSLVKYKDKILAFGGNYIDVFEDVGNPTGSPLRRVDELCINDYGLIAPSAGQQTSSGLDLIEAFDTVFWINSGTTSSGVGIYQLDNLKPVRVSPPEMENILATGFVTGIAGGINLFGHRYLILNTSASYLVFLNLDLQVFTYWLGPSVAINGAYILPEIGGQSTEFVVWTDSRRGRIEYGTGVADVWSDFGTGTNVNIMTSLIDFGTEKRKRLHQLTLIGFDALATTTVSINWTDNDYVSFNTARTVDMNNFRAYLTNCGSFRRRAFQISTTGAPFQVEALELEYSELNS